MAAAMVLRHVGAGLRNNRLSSLDTSFYQTNRNHHSAKHRFSCHLKSSSHKSGKILTFLNHRSVISSSFIRYNSSTTTAEDITSSTVSVTNGEIGSFQGAYIPEPPAIPEVLPDTTESIQHVLNALGEPTLASLGLGNAWTPAGWVQIALETLHVSCDLPWWGAIVAGTVFLRCCVFPLVIQGQKNSARLNNHMPTITRLQERFTEARQSGNHLDAAKCGNELMDYMKRNNVKPFRNLLVPIAQVPVFISVFMGLRKMANYPVGSMTTGGALWFTDLTLADPYFAMPLMTMLTFLLTIEVGVDGVRAANQGHVIKWVLRIMPIILFPMISNFPAAMLVYWMTSNTFSLAQVLFLKIPEVRQFFKIEKLVRHPPGASNKKGFVQGFKETWNNSKTIASVDDRMRADEMAFRNAGIGPLQKTFKHDPTKVTKKK